ncbi:homocysteine S-methyltransferase family protein [Raoultibacter phocaeensis]|uniref:homocysteine S-methyltransferase family protein n=1 Tax=Raoultibacter phocaeensis TaxID=2479841 RepID=UPI0011180B14|nr:homocysteine S-methyltransferase family protein [Raoultibacter phocaeensis]
MPDIEMRFNRDMLVFSAPIDEALGRQGVDVEKDREFISLIEPEAVRNVYQLETVAGAQCLVTNTAGITAARLAHSNMEDRAPELAEAALAVLRSLRPQHIVAEIGPTYLPIDASSASSLKQSRNQYAEAARAFGRGSVDALFLNGMVSLADLQCALMGARMVFDGPVFASVDVEGTGLIARRDQPIEEALDLMAEYGADVAGFSTAAPLDEAVAIARRARAAFGGPVLVQLAVRKHNPRQGAPTAENPYYCPDIMIEAATRLRGAGVQFLRATGNATSPYTGALVAASAGFDVVNA